MKVEMDVPGSPSVIASPYGLCGRKATLNQLKSTHQSSGAVCESRGVRPRLPVPNSPYGHCGRKATLKRKKKFDFRLIREQTCCVVLYQRRTEKVVL